MNSFLSCMLIISSSSVSFILKRLIVGISWKVEEISDWANMIKKTIDNVQWLP
jgi:hypothetical protein